MFLNLGNYPLMADAAICLEGYNQASVGQKALESPGLAPDQNGGIHGRRRWSCARRKCFSSPNFTGSELEDAFWVASGVPALVLFSICGIAATVGTPSVLGTYLVGHLRLVQALADGRKQPFCPFQQVWRRIVLWRSGLGALLQVHRAAFGLGQLACLDARARHRLRHCRRLHLERAFRARRRDPPAPGRSSSRTLAS